MNLYKVKTVCFQMGQQRVTLRHGMNDVQAANDLASVLADSLHQFRNSTGGVVVVSPIGGRIGGGNVGSRLDDVLQRTFNHTATKSLRDKNQGRVLAGALRAVSNSVLADAD